MGHLGKLISLWFLLLASTFFFNCEPGDALKIDEPPKPVDTGTVIKPTPEFQNGISLGYPDWPLVYIKDSSYTLELLVLDTSGTRGYPDVKVQIQVLDTGYAKIEDTTSAQFSSFTTSNKGRVTFKLKVRASTQASLRVKVINSVGTTVFSEDRTLRLSAPQSSNKVIQRLKFEVVEPIIRADGNSRTVLRVTVKDPNNNPIVGEKVHFTSTGGVVVASATTDSAGIALGWLRSERVNDTVFVRASLVDGAGILSETQTVVFSGVKILIQSLAGVAKVGERTEVIFELRDGADELLTNDSMYIEVSGTTGWAGTTRKNLVVVSDAFGQYKTWVTSANSGEVILFARALGAQTQSKLSYTNNTISFLNSPKRLTGNGIDSAQITVKVQNGANEPFSGITLLWTTSFGNFTSKPITSTGPDGQSSIVFKTPNGVGEAHISVVAKKGEELLARSVYSFSVSAILPKRLELTISPDNIPVGVGLAVLTAKAYDDNGDIINDLLIGFKLIKSAGAGDEKIVLPTVITQQGQAKTIINAGSTISEYRSVRITAQALSVQGKDTVILASSDTLGLTVSGPPARISLGHNIHKGLNPNDGTFELPIAAIVRDVNGNLVSDGTQVNFSLVPNYYIPYLNEASDWVGPVNDSGIAVEYYFTRTRFAPYYEVGKRKKYSMLPWTDYNNNLKLDEGEEPNRKTGKPYRGEDRNGDGIINIPPEQYIDLNGNGRFESGICPPNFKDSSECDFAEPFFRPDSQKFLVYVDYNGNGRHDARETILGDNGDGLCQCVGGRDSLGNDYDYEYNFDGGRLSGEAPHPFGMGGGVKATATTKDGKALNGIKYPQNEGNRAGVRITAEANGISTSLNVILPIVKDEEE